MSTSNNSTSLSGSGAGKDKDDDGSSRLPEPHPSSLESIRCVICLEDVVNPCCGNTCQHQFCLQCLLKWSKTKRECPLCKLEFTSIYHNFRSTNGCDEKSVLAPASQINSPAADIDRHSSPMTDGSHRAMVIQTGGSETRRSTYEELPIPAPVSEFNTFLNISQLIQYSRRYSPEVKEKLGKSCVKTIVTGSSCHSNHKTLKVII